LLLCGLLFLQTGFSQRSAEFISADLLFREGKYMFDTGNYSGCISKMLNYKKTANVEPSLIEEADFFIVASGFHKNCYGTGAELTDYLKQYPTTVHYNEICFMIGSSYFRLDNYQQAVVWFSKVELNNLSVTEQEDYAYQLGYSCTETENYTEAERLFHLLKNKSTNYRDAATYYLGYLNYSKLYYKESLAYFNEVKNNPDFRPDVLYYIAQISFAQGHYSQVVSEGKNLLDNYSKHKYNANTERIIGLSYFEEGDYPNTVKYLGEFLNNQSGADTKDLYALGLACFYQNKYAEAITALNKCNPADNALGQNIYLHLGQSYLKQNDAQKAMMAFQSASRMDYDAEAKEAALYNYAMLLHQNSVSAFGESVTALENFINNYPYSMYADKVNSALVAVYLTTKDYDTALASIAKIKNPDVKIREAQQKIFYYIGTVNFTNSKYPDAIQYFTKAISAGNYAVTEKNEAIYWRGESYYKSENYDKASADFRSYINSDAKSDNLSKLALYNLAYCAFNQKQYSAAQTGFLRYITSETAQSPVLADAYARLGDCYFFNRRFAEAENAYNRAVSIAPQKGDYALFQKGYVLGLQKDYTGKITQMNNLISEYPESPYLPDAIYEKGRACVLMENTAQAIVTYQELISRFPESSNARKAGLQIGLLYFNDNQPEKSADAYKKVITKYPGSEEAKTAIQDLKSVYFDLNDVNGYAEYVKSLGDAARFDVTEQDSLTYFAAERFFLRNETQKAQSGMISYLQQFPEGAFSINAHYYLAQTYFSEKNITAAKTEFQKVIEAGNNQFIEESLLRLSEIYYENGDLNEALPLYERLQNTAENRSNRNTGALGVIRTASRLGKYNQAALSANLLLKAENAEPTVAVEARYYRAKAYLALGENTLAENDLKDLSKDTRTTFGAESKYRLAQHYFDSRQTGKARETVKEYIQQGTPHAYWLARSFILMADLYAAEGETLQARQYLESLQNSYKSADDDIKTLIKERLNR
jgi:TolA-binding protein